MPYKTKLPTPVDPVEVDLVEARVTVWASPMDPKHVASAVMSWKLTLMRPDNRETFIGGANTDKIYTLYNPTLEAGGNELLCDGKPVYTLDASGAGKWYVELRIMARKAGGAGTLVEIGYAKAGGDAFMPYNGRSPAPALPAGGKASVGVNFTWFDG